MAKKGSALKLVNKKTDSSKETNSRNNFSFLIIKARNKLSAVASKLSFHQRIFLMLSIFFILMIVFVLVNLTRYSIFDNNFTEIIYSSNVKFTEDGVQVIEITAKNGFKPDYVVAKAGVQTILRFNTYGTIDCSNVVNIPSLGIKEQLPINGHKDIDIGSMNYGREIIASCNVGYYKLRMKFI